MVRNLYRDHWLLGAQKDTMPCQKGCWKWMKLLVLLLAITGQLAGQSQLEIEGVLKGYFLTSEGTLSVYEVPFHFPPKAYNTALPSRLYPVWSRYYLKMRVRAAMGKIQHLQIQVGRHKHSVTKENPTEQVSISEDVSEWLSVHAKSQLSIKVMAKMASGSTVIAHPSYAVQIGDLQPLKIDWRDFVRISQIREFLRQHGDKILPGLRADDVPILLEGEEGQGVLVGGKFPNEWRYKGIVPAGLQVYLLPFRIIVPPKIKERVLAGIVKVRQVGIVAILHYQPGWDSIEEINNIQSSRHNERMFALLHEIVHYWIGRRFGWRHKPKGLSSFDLDGYLAWVLEGNALTRALASQGQPQREVVRDFLFFRWLRRRLGCGDAQEEQNAEWDEGVAYAAAEKALELAVTHLRLNPVAYLPHLSIDLEAFEKPLTRVTLPFNPIGEPFYHQFSHAQARILTELVPNWLSQVPTRRALESLLADVIGFLPEGITALTEEQARQKVCEYAQKLGVTILPSLPEPQDGLMLVWLVIIGNLPSKLPPKNLPFVVFKNGCDFIVGKTKIQSHREVMIAQVKHQKGTLLLFGWRLKPGEALQFKAEGKEVTGQGQGIAARAVDVEVWQAPRLILVGPKGLARMWAEMLSKSQEVRTMKLAKAWTTIAVAMTLASGVAQGQGMQITGSVSGIFLNAWTGQREFHIINLVPSLDMSDYSLLEPIDDEEYQITISVADHNAQLLRLALVLTDGQEVSVESDQPTNQLTLTYRGKWHKFLRPIGELVEWIGRTAVKIVKTIGEQMLEQYLKDLLPGKKKGTLAIHVRITDAEQSTVQGFAGVTVEVWRGGKRIVPPTNATWVIFPDANGDFSRLLPEAPDYLVRAIRVFQFPACREAWAGPVKVEENQTTRVQVRFYYHKPIKGRVMEQTSNGQVALSGAKAYLYKGDQQLSGSWESDSNGYFFIPYFVIDGALAQYGSGTYTVKVIPPARSMLRPEPMEGSKEVTLRRCERLKPHDVCPRALTVDVGTFYFTYKPAYPGPGGG